MNHYINLLKKIFKEFINLTLDYGIKFAFFNLIWWLNFYFRSPFTFKCSKWALDHKTKFLTNYIEKNFNNIIEKYKDKPSSSETNANKTIWIFWGQGEEQMPVLVKACFNHLKDYNDNVILLTAENYGKYADIPQEIIEKCKEGKLSWAHFSDILRNTLLFQNGGLWLDATVWTRGKIPWNILETRKFFSPNSPVKLNKNSICFWTSFKFNWSSWCMWSDSKYLNLFGFVYEIMKNQSLSKKVWPDYVFQDFLYFYAIKNLPNVENLFLENSKIESKGRNELAQLMNTPYNQKLYDKLCKDNIVFKLSFRTPWKSTTTMGVETFYGKLIFKQ